MNEADPPAKPRSDLGVRTASGVVMMLVALGAIWAGGWVFGLLVIAVGIGVLREWFRLASSFGPNISNHTVWYGVGLIYVAVACYALMSLGGVFGDHPETGVLPAVALIAGVIGTDIGAYFAGRTFGGPKIAPKISPSKTWSGLVGGMIGATLMLILVASKPFYRFSVPNDYMHDTFYVVVHFHRLILAGAAIAIMAQVGDFFESWMKRRAGVKDSGALIPGHGGLFDRADGLLAVSFLAGLLLFAGVL